MTEEIKIKLESPLKDNLMFRIIIEEKQFDLIENQLGYKINKPTIINNINCIIRDIKINEDYLIFYIENIEVN